MIIENCSVWQKLSVNTQLIYSVSQKSIPDIFDCNLKTNYQILIIFGMNIGDKIYHQMTI